MEAATLLLLLPLLLLLLLYYHNGYGLKPDPRVHGGVGVEPCRLRG